MKVFILLSLLFGMSGCAALGLGGGSPAPSGSPKPSHELGDCKPCPYDWSDADGKPHSCSPPGCHCIDDNANHSDPSKCLKQ